MAERHADIIIHGGGIAGLWTLNLLKNLGYDALLVEPRAIGGIQTIASQGIIHSGMKYVLGGKINPLARAISTMPEVWKSALRGEGPIDLSKAKIAAESQQLLIPKGMIGSIMKIGAKNFFGHEIDAPANIKNAGFEGSVVDMGEPVLDIPSLIRALAEPHLGAIRKSAEGVTAKKYIYTAAAGNDQSGIATQRRPLLMGLIKNAPFSLWAHCVGASDKPVATITTHKANDGMLVWYIGGQAAERKKESDPKEVYDAMHGALKKYLPGINLANVRWATFPIDRIEAKSGGGFMPDTPVIHESGDKIYAWPTKLTFAPALGDKIVETLAHSGISPSHNNSDWSYLPEVPYAEPPWEMVQWTKDR
jgi:hypothetical protein